MQLRTKRLASLSLAFAGTALAVVACGGSSSSSKDTSDTSASTGGAGDTGGGGVTDAGGTSGTSGTSIGNTNTTAATSASNTMAGDAGGSGGTSSTAGGTGGSAAATGGGAGGTSGAAGETATSDSGGTAGSGGTGPTGVIGVLGEPCDSPGQLACAGNHQKLTVVCGGDGEWQVNETCGATEFCDSSEGPTTGLCIEPAEGCAGREPGELVCGGASVVTCDVDGLRTIVVEECTTPCVEGACADTGAPCPDEEFVNCSRQCGDFECLESEEGCVQGQPLDAYLEDVGDSVIVRTASYGDLCERAGERCGEEVRAMPVGAFNVRLRCTVEAPWGIITEARLAEDACAERLPCEIVEVADVSSTVAYVETSDPTAGAANVLVEVVDEEATCP